MSKELIQKVADYITVIAPAVTAIIAVVLSALEQLDIASGAVIATLGAISAAASKIFNIVSGYKSSGGVAEAKDAS
jgi:hypothetical protein